MEKEREEIIRKSKERRLADMKVRVSLFLIIMYIHVYTCTYMYIHTCTGLHLGGVGGAKLLSRALPPWDFTVKFKIYIQCIHV